MAKVLFLCTLLAFGFTANALEQKGDRTITKVVKLLQSMLDKSKTEGDEERTIYAKFKCYCDTSEAEKNDSVKALSEQIELLSSKIAEIQGETGELSSEVAELKANMAANQQAQSDATSLRNKENSAFNAEEKDLTAAIAQMKSAIEVLSSVGADQTDGKGAADTKQFMAAKKANLISLQSQVQTALKAASSLMNSEQRSTAAAFVQAPFTGTYTSQSGVVMGIIKSMRDTFKANLGDARTTEKNALESYDKFMEVKTSAFKTMKASFQEKQKELGSNDDELSSKKKALSEAESQKASDEEFLGSLLPLCADKAKGYSNRKLLRANEEAAIAQAISILNSDAAFESFGGQSATKTGANKKSFLQVWSVNANNRILAKTELQLAAEETQSARLGKVITMLVAGNPFTGVLDEISKMLDLIGEEAKADKENLDWCSKERRENKAALSGKKKDIISLDTSIDKFDTTINDPKTGLKAMIEETETSLVQNTESQKTETGERTEANVAYQADIKNSVDAQSILTKGIKVLKAYYNDLEKKLAAGEALLQKEDPAAPEAWKGDGAYAGQSKQGGDVIDMLEFILSEASKEEMDAHASEEKSQADYEDSMTVLKKEEAKAEKSLAKLQDDLATKEKELLDAREDHKATTKDKEAIEDYLLKIKPGCDFISTNFDTREANRKTEKNALEKAVRLIKATPAYKTSMAEAKVESFGDCKKPCQADETHVKCKSCQADVTIPAFCAGHKGTKGC